MLKRHVLDGTWYTRALRFADYEFGEGGVQIQIYILVVLLIYY